MASIAQEEVRKLSERVKFGFQRSIENGKVLGNDAIWGYKKDNCKLVIVPEEAEIIKRTKLKYEATPFHLLIKKPIANAATIDKIIIIKPKISILYKILFG